MRLRVLAPIALVLESAVVLGFPGRASAAAPPAGAIVVGTPSASCPSPDFATINGAISAASTPSGATIFVCAGDYPESVTVNKDVTLLGPQFDVPATSDRTNPAAEAVITAPAGGDDIRYANPATTGTVNGLTLAGAGHGIFAVDATLGGVKWIDNIITTTGPSIQLHAQGATVTGNRLENMTAGGEGAIFMTNGTSNDVTVADNAFLNDSIDINNVGVAGPPPPPEFATGLVIRDNSSENSGNFAILALTSNAVINGNTIRNSRATAIFVGGGNTGTTIARNTIAGGNATGISVTRSFHTNLPNQVAAIQTNMITNRSNGIVIGAGTEQSPSTVIADNVVTDATNNGIWLQSGTGITVTGNRALGSGGTDCVDTTTDSGTAGTANIWTANLGRTSDPDGLCTPPAPPTITSGPPPSGAVGQRYEFTVTATDTMPIHFTLSAGKLPPGLTLDERTGRISGTPTTAGTFKLTITASNEFGSDSQTYTIHVAPAAGPAPCPPSTPPPQTTPPGPVCTTLPTIAGQAGVGPPTSPFVPGPGLTGDTPPGGLPLGLLLGAGALVSGAAAALLLRVQSQRHRGSHR